MKNKVSIGENYHFIEGDYPESFDKIVDLYNTWIEFFHKEFYVDGYALRYKGTRGDAIMRDSIELGKSITEYINNGYEPTIGMISFMEEIKCEKGGRYDLGIYKYPVGWHPYKDMKHCIHMEYSFFKMIELFKVDSFKIAMDKAGINISIDVS